ncbi:hypothetical protein Aduo_017160 [Ancylostoma duodenale]
MKIAGLLAMLLMILPLISLGSAKRTLLERYPEPKDIDPWFTAMWKRTSSTPRSRRRGRRTKTSPTPSVQSVTSPPPPRLTTKKKRHHRPRPKIVL